MINSALFFSLLTDSGDWYFMVISLEIDMSSWEFQEHGCLLQEIRTTGAAYFG